MTVAFMNAMRERMAQTLRALMGTHPRLKLKVVGIAGSRAYGYYVTLEPWICNEAGEDILRDDYAMPRRTFTVGESFVLYDSPKIEVTVGRI